MSFFGPELVAGWVGSLVATAGSDGSKMESSDMMLASKLVIEGEAA